MHVVNLLDMIILSCDIVDFFIIIKKEVKVGVTLLISAESAKLLDSVGLYHRLSTSSFAV